MALLAARGLARLVALILTAALAVAGLAVAVFSIQGDSSTLSLPTLARHAQLGHLLGDAGDFLASLEADGPTAKIAALAGAGAVLLGLLLLFGVLGRRRERLIVMRRDADGTVAARPRAVGHAAATLAEQSRDVLDVKARTGARRRGTGGRLRLTVHLGRSTDRAAATVAIRDRVQALTGGFSLRLRVRGHGPRRRARAR
jgi:hypothetical protein